MKIIKLDPSRGPLGDLRGIIDSLFQQMLVGMNVPPQPEQFQAREAVRDDDDSSSSASSSDDKRDKKTEVEYRQPFWDEGPAMNRNQGEGFKAKGDNGADLPVRHVINFLPRDSPKNLDFVMNAAKRRMNKLNGVQSDPMVMQY